MSTTKLITTFLLALAVLFAQVGTAAAAPQAQDVTTISGTIEKIEPGTDLEGNTVILVTLKDDLGNIQTLQFSLMDATTLELVTVDPNTNEITVNESLYGTTGEFDPNLATIVEESVEESNHPISVLLAAFFDLDASEIDGFHDDGFGFGVIAQALWVSQNLGGDTSLTGDILQAKQDKEFEAFFETHPEYLADGETPPTNWGQFKKLLSEKKNNLGVVVSGKAEKTTDDTANAESLNTQDKGNDKSKEKSNNGKNKDKDKGKGKP